MSKHIDGIPVREVDLAQAIYADARQYHVVWEGLLNALARIGNYRIDGRFSRWYVQREGVNLHPDRGFHSFEDMLTAIIEDIKRHD